MVGEVVGSLWSTIADPNFAGTKLMLVQPYDVVARQPSGSTVVAADTVSAGVGDRVLVVYEGSSSRLSLGSEKTPCEAVIVGIVDSIDLEGQPSWK